MVLRFYRRVLSSFALIPSRLPPSEPGRLDAPSEGSGRDTLRSDTVSGREVQEATAGTLGGYIRRGCYRVYGLSADGRRGLLEYGDIVIW